MLKRIKNDNRGAAMAVALLCIMVLSLLGVALWQYFMTDTLHTAKDEKSMQAYYLARSGADAVARYIIKNPDKKTDAQMEAFIDTLVTSPKSDAVAFGKGNFAVQVTRDSKNVLHIKSEGVVSDSTKIVNLSLTPVGTPATPSDALDASDLGWFNGRSFNIDKDEVGIYPEDGIDKKASVKFDPTNGATHINIKSVNGHPYFRVANIFFEHGISPDNTSILYLSANIIVIRGDLILNTQQKKGTAQLSLVGPYSDDGVDESTIKGAKAGVQYGRIYFDGDVYLEGTKKIEKGSYYFPQNCILPPVSNKYNDWALDAGLIRFNSTGGYIEEWN